MTVVTRSLGYLCATVVMVGVLGMAASAACADDTWKPDPPDGYPPGWNVKSTPPPQAYDYKVGTGTMELAGRAATAPERASDLPDGARRSAVPPDHSVGRDFSERAPRDIRGALFSASSSKIPQRKRHGWR